MWTTSLFELVVLPIKVTQSLGFDPRIWDIHCYMDKLPTREFASQSVPSPPQDPAKLRQLQQRASEPDGLELAMTKIWRLHLLISVRQNLASHPKKCTIIYIYIWWLKCQPNCDYEGQAW